MPLTAAGTLTIVPSQDLGPLGPHEGEPLQYHWGIGRALLWAGIPLLLRAMPWLFLVLLLLDRENRTWRAWMATIPAFLVAAPVLLMCRPNEQLAGVYSHDFAALFLGLTLLWLFTGRLSRREPIKSLGLAVLIMGFPPVCGALAAFMTHEDLEPFRGQWAFPVMGVLVPLALVLSRLLCGKRYSATRFRIGLLPSLLVVTMLAAAFVPQSTVRHSGESFLLQNAFSITPVVTLGLWLCLLYYLLLSSCNRVYVDRFCTLFGPTCDGDSAQRRG